MTNSWHTAEQIQQIVRRRRIRRGMATGAVVLAVAGTSIGLDAAGTSTPRTPAAVIVPGSHVGARLDGAIELVGNTSPLRKADPAALASAAEVNRALTIALLDHSGLLAGAGPNVQVSPLSLYLTLGMLQNGAHGITQAQIAQALQGSSLSTATQDAGLEQLSSTLTSAASQDGVALQTADSLWQQNGFVLEPKFLSTIATYFHAGVWQTDFRTDKATTAINQWVSQQTHGKITKLFDELDPSTLLVLANALYFHADWKTPFDSAQTKPGAFTTAAGKVVRPDFMTGVVVPVTTTPNYAAAHLAYLGGHFEAVAVLPTHDELTDFVDSLSAADLDQLLASPPAASQEDITLPRFVATSSTDLIPMLKALGMTAAFDPATADFSALSHEPSYVGQVLQRVYLGVGEKGTTAAAVTGIAVEPSSLRYAPSTLTFDRPFLFLIRDRVTGAILFASEINDPTAG